MGRGKKSVGRKMLSAEKMPARERSIDHRPPCSQIGSGQKREEPKFGRIRAAKYRRVTFFIHERRECKGEEGSNIRGEIARLRVGCEVNWLYCTSNRPAGPHREKGEGTGKKKGIKPPAGPCPNRNVFAVCLNLWWEKDRGEPGHREGKKRPLITAAAAAINLNIETNEQGRAGSRGEEKGEGSVRHYRILAKKTIFTYIDAFQQEGEREYLREKHFRIR